MAKVKITLVRGLAGKSKRKKATLAALGLHKRGATTVKELNPAIEGMIEKVKELVIVEPLRGRYVVNWHQKKAAGYKPVIHDLQNEDGRCKISKLRDFDVYETLEEAINAIKSKGYSEYAKCSWCMEH